MNRFVAGISVVLSFITFCAAQSAEQKPNFILILADHLRYGDVGCYGVDNLVTPHIDRMISESSKVTIFYFSTTCSATRASLMTGCIAERMGIGGVLFPRNNHGLNSDKRTLPELPRDQCYAIR